MFVTGPTKSGKSVLLRQNLHEFISKGSHVSSKIFIFLITCCLIQNPVVFHFDFDELNSMTSFDVFLANFEAMLVETLVEHKDVMFQNDKQDGLDTLLKVAFRFYDRNLLE